MGTKLGRRTNHTAGIKIQFGQGWRLNQTAERPVDLLAL
jgi:hypothetical protein